MTPDDRGRDRRVHARLEADQEIVRYDRAGKWYMESPFWPRKQLTLKEAAWYARWNSVEVFFGLPGGLAFDRAVRALEDPDD